MSGIKPLTEVCLWECNGGLKLRFNALKRGL